MRPRVLFFYIMFVALACAVAITADEKANKKNTDIARKMNAENPSSSAVDDGAVSCDINMRCPDCNFILLSVDSLRADHIGAYGYARDTTPYFDALAKKGVLFENYFSTSFLTPISEMSVHTGMYPSAHKVTNFDTVLPEETVTIAQYMKQKGYATAALLSSPEFEFDPAGKISFSRGFERYEYVPSDQTDPNDGFRMFPSNNQIKSEINNLISKKFFWWIGIGGVHWPYGEQGPNVFADDTYNGFFKENLLDFEVFGKIYKGVRYPSGLPIGNADIQYVIDQYDNGINAFDKFLKQIINELQQKNILNQTIIIIQSEHGEDLNEHGYFAHYDIMDTQTHVPLLILYPNSDTECRISSFAGSVDVFPTIVELLTQAPLNQFQGKSLVPIINGSEKDGMRQEVFLERNPLWEETSGFDFKSIGSTIDVCKERHKDIGIRTPRWKYILRTSKQAMEKINWWQAITGKKMYFPEAELYDLINNPEETKNVINQYPDEATVLREKLQNWFNNISSSSQKNIEIIPIIQPYF